MYTIYAYMDDINTYIYVPSSDTLQLYDITIDYGVNQISQLKFTMPPTNPFYENIKIGQQQKVIVYEDGNIFWEGFIHRIDTNFKKEKTVICDDLLYLLTTTIQQPHHYSNVTYNDMLDSILETHNNQRRDFATGYDAVEIIRGGIYDGDDIVPSRYTNYENTWQVLNDDLINSRNQIMYLTWNGESYSLNTDTLDKEAGSQYIEFGYNLLNFSTGLDMSELYTQICPIGARLETQTIVGLDDYVTIKSVNNNNPVLTSANEQLIEQYGARCLTVQWEDVTTPSVLKTRARDWLNGKQFTNLTINLNALDMSILNPHITAFNVGATVRVIAPPFGIDVNLPVQKITKNISDPTKSTITLSFIKQLSYTQMQTRQNNQFRKELLR